MEIAARQRDLLSRAFQMSLSHMRELADIVRKAQGDAFAVVKGQVERDVRELVGRAQGKGGGKARPAAAKKAKAARNPKTKRGARPAGGKAGAAAAVPKTAATAKAARKKPGSRPKAAKTTAPASTRSASAGRKRKAGTPATSSGKARTRKAAKKRTAASP